jgi:hypothetical protein
MHEKISCKNKYISIIFSPSQFLIASTKNSTSSNNKLMKHNKIRAFTKLGVNHRLVIKRVRNKNKENKYN